VQCGEVDPPEAKSADATGFSDTTFGGTVVGMTATAGRPKTRRFTADEVWQMVDMGLLGEDEPYELLDGELLYVSPQGETHAKIIGRLNMLFAREYGPSDHVVRVQCPVGGIVDSIPEPDLAVVTLDVAEQDGRPTPEQVVLLVEVAATSQTRDRRKGEIYASAGASEYWIVDIPREVVTIHASAERDGTWEEVRQVGVDGTLTLPGKGVTIAAAAVLRSQRRSATGGA
jgi:Uma2 family endonuclease